MAECACHDSLYSADAEGLPDGLAISEDGRSAGEALAEILSLHAEEFGLDMDETVGIIREAGRGSRDVEAVSEFLLETLTPFAQARGITIEQS